MSLWDDVHRVPGPISDWSGVEAFDVSDVMRLYWEGPDEILNFEKLPNVAPPFKRYFMFGTAPTRRAGGEQIVLDDRSATAGVLFDSARLPSGGWSVRAWYSVARDSLWQGVFLAYRVDDDGQLGAWTPDVVPHLVSHEWWRKNDFSNPNNRFFAHGPALTEMTELLRTATGRTDFVNVEAEMCYPFMLATSILHCKNITARRVHPPEKLAKAAAKRGRPIYSYSVLDVKPVRRILDDEGGMSHGASLAKALHVCRGHFKDYRDGAGLFGKVKGLFWWEQSLRGNVANGVHVKDYRVKT